MESYSTEALLIAGLKRGDELAYRHLFDLYYRHLVTFANRILLDADSSRNVVQDVYVMLYDKRDTINIHTNLKALLYQSVRNRCINALKHEKMKRGHHHQIAAFSGELTMPSQHVEVEELESCIRETIEGLPGQCQRIFKMSRYEGHSNQEIATALDLSKRTVESQISKALRILREELSRRELLLLLGFVSLLAFAAG